MKIQKAILLFLIFSISFFSCKKDEEHLGRKKLSEIQLWTYKLSSSNYIYEENRVPAIDENDNIYTNSFNGMTANDDVYSFSKDGVLRWDKKSDGFICSKIVYKSNKIFFITHQGDIENKINCLNSSTGAVEWKANCFGAYEDHAFAVTDDALFYASSDSLFKYDLTGNFIAKIQIYNSLSDECLSMSVFNHDIYILAQMGNTFMTHIFKCSENADVLTKDWEILFISDNPLFDKSQTNASVDLSINDLGDVVVLSTGGLYCFDKNGDLKWKNTKDFNLYDYKKTNNARALSSTTITDSGYVLIGYEQLYKLNTKGNIVSNTVNGFAGFELRRAPIIAQNGRYYTVTSGNSTDNGVRVLNSDLTQYWYSILLSCRDVPAMLHNGNLVFVNEGVLYCIKTEAGGIDQNAQWPKIYYDYGNTSYKKN